MYKSQYCITLLALSVILVSMTQCASPSALGQHPGAQQSDAPPVVGFMTTPGPELQGVAEGKVLPLEFNGGNLRATVLAHPVPDIWLIFPSKENRDSSRDAKEDTSEAKVELPVEAKKILKAQWETALAAEYDWTFGDLPSVRSRSLLSVVVFQASQEASRKLTKIPVDTPSGRRLMTLDEGISLANFVGRSVVDVVKQAKRIKGQENYE